MITQLKTIVAVRTLWPLRFNVGLYGSLSESDHSPVWISSYYTQILKVCTDILADLEIKKDSCVEYSVLTIVYYAP